MHGGDGIALDHSEPKAKGLQLGLPTFSPGTLFEFFGLVTEGGPENVGVSHNLASPLFSVFFLVGEGSGQPVLCFPRVRPGHGAQDLLDASGRERLLIGPTTGLVTCPDFDVRRGDG